MERKLRTSRRATAIFTIFALAALLSACNLPGVTTDAGAPSAEIQAPADGSTVAVGEAVTITTAATDENGDGVASVEVFVNGETLGVQGVPDGPSAAAVVTHTWTPSEEGEANIMALAYREDDTASPPASITVTVVGMTPDATQEQATATTESGGEGAEPTEQTAEPGGGSGATQYVRGRADLQAAIRSGPGPYCPQIGTVRVGDELNLMEYSLDKLWFKTDYLGPNDIGWVYYEPIAILGNQDDIPHGNRQGCQGCGDGTCNADENCDECPEDCGSCCGNGTCEPDYGEDCGTCEDDCGACCGNGTCEPGRDETCDTCPDDCGACCGNGTCEEEYDEDCGTCPDDCGDCCGNGTCEADRDETCDTCPDDCGDCCGNGTCEADYGEDCETCEDDCGACAPECGDGICNGDEDCETCPDDCGECPEPVCGNGTVEPGEDCESNADCAEGYFCSSCVCYQAPE
jgi:predicted RNA-binding protein with TRAM domain